MKKNSVKLTKKLVTLVLTGMLSVGALTGCGSDSVSQSKVPAQKYDIVLDDLTVGENQYALDYVNSLGFSNPEFRQSFYEYLANGAGNCFINAKQEDVCTIEISNVSDLTDLRLFPNLKKVIIKDSSISDFSQLSQLRNLEVLEINDTNLDCTTLANITTKKLSFNHSNPTNTQALSSIKGVQDLEINYSHFHSLDFINGWNSLTDVSLSNADIDNFDVLRNKNLNSLKISFCQVDDWSFIKDVNTKSLDLSYSNFSDFSLINGSGLVSLDLSYSFLTSVDGISKFGKLQNLDIGSCQNLTNFDEVSKLGKLKKFDCTNLEMQIDNNTITNIINNTEEFQGFDVQVQRKVKELYNSIGITDDMTDEEKVRSICLTVLDLLQFTQNQTVEDVIYCNLHELASALQQDGNCASYTGITCALLDLANVENMSIVGENFEDDENYLHRWIVVKINGEWKGLDVTFLDDIEASDTLKSGEDSMYFLDELDDTDWMEYHYPYFMPESDSRVVFAR